MPIPKYRNKNKYVKVLPFPYEQKFEISCAIKLFEYMASNLSILAILESVYSMHIAFINNTFLLRKIEKN